MSDYHSKLEEIRTKAFSVCNIMGDDHEECVEALEKLELLEQMEETIYETMIDSLENYCLKHPDAQECSLLNL